MSYFPTIPFHTKPIAGTGGTSRGLCEPITFYAKNVALIPGSTTDIVVFTIPPEITKWAVYASLDGSGNYLGGIIQNIAYVESGTVSSAAFDINTAIGGGGTTIGSFDKGILAGVGTFETSGFTVPSPTIFTSSSLVIRQLSQTGAATVSFYLTIFPIR